MTPSVLNSIAVATGLLCSAAALAEHRKGDGYERGLREIEVHYQAAALTCDPLAGNAFDLCMSVATGRERVAVARIEARFNPSTQNDYEIRIAEVEAVFAIAQERCDEAAGSSRSVCLDTAAATHASATADVDAQQGISEVDASLWP